ncbi:MAG: DUF2231 domain-containing protein [Deltaproteobacteria bacterium]|nr:DUF2231 domain-containing protein [Deltaproteobacteria bacterium]
MNSRVKVVGHPIHPMLVVFPLGLLASSLVFDFIALATGNSDWAVSSFYMIAAGIVGGLAAAVFGLLDWLSVPSGTRARALGAWHGLGNVVVVVLFAVAWALRFNQRTDVALAPLVLQILAVGMALVTGWLGGELVDRMGIGVDDGANPDAPSSLSGRRASERVQ